MKQIPENRRVRMFVRMDCSHKDGLIAAEFFTVFQKIIGSRFMRAEIEARQYDREKFLTLEQIADCPFFAPLDLGRYAPFVAMHDGNCMLCLRDMEERMHACEVSETFAKMWMEEFAYREGGAGNRRPVE